MELSVEQSLYNVTWLITLLALPLVVVNEVWDALCVLVPALSQFLRKKNYASGCTERSSKSLLAYYSASTNTIVPPELLLHSYRIVNIIANGLVHVAQVVSFCLCAFPYISIGFSLAFSYLQKRTSLIKIFTPIILLLSIYSIIRMSLANKEDQLTSAHLNTTFILLGALFAVIILLYNTLISTPNNKKIAEKKTNNTKIWYWLFDYPYAGFLIFSTSRIIRFISWIIKKYFNNPRPEGGYGLSARIQCELGNGNPSSQTATGLAYGGILLILWRYWMQEHIYLFYNSHQLGLKQNNQKKLSMYTIPGVILFAILGVGVPMSRIALGYNTFLQILFGLMLGLWIFYILSICDWLITSYTNRRR
ncbi:MAG: hypothetical protein EZS28_034708 [Streblomastix strix]|uniref:Phosphatidic acid phosphatase type 2/haloperoxidase domain-containing protein n=1 Tax=Streblomastix strix TaxID=222440 RepID=A0A5J4UHY6_9EUKA|nr:MAG: hypothetical protein EZS28_034708 [Streblomastix strix]